MRELLHYDAARSYPLPRIEGLRMQGHAAAGFTTIRDVGNAGNYADTALASHRARPGADRRCRTPAASSSVRRAISFAAEKRDLANAGICVRRYHDEMLKHPRKHHYGAT